MNGPDDDDHDVGDTTPIVFDDGPDFDPLQPPIDLLDYEERSISHGEQQERAGWPDE